MLKGTSIEFRKTDAMNLTKLVGRQHSFLSDIVEELNYCNSFKVLHLLFTSVFLYQLMLISSFFGYI